MTIIGEEMSVLTLQLRTKRGYSCDARHKITDAQWEAINAILNGSPEAVTVMREARAALQFAYDMHRRARNTVPDEEEGLASQIFCHHINQTDGPILDAINTIDAALLKVTR